MTLQQNTDHIQTTHIGSLPRPHALLDLMKAKFTGQPFDEVKFEALLAQAVNDVVRKQVDCGIEIVTDGEFSKPGFFTYIQERLEGFEARPGQKMKLFVQEVAAFPDYYKEYFKTAMMGGAIVTLAPVVCVGPVKYRGEKFVRRDIANVKKAAAAAGVPDHHVFLPATAASGVGIERILQERRRLFSCAGSRARQGISRHRRRRHIGPDRRSVPAGYLLRAGSRPRADAAPRRDLCRGDQHRAQRHCARARALSHLLRHQRRAAALRSRA